MLRQRVLTAMVLVAVLLGVMLGLPPIATIWLVTVLILIGAWEWAAFIGNGSAPARATFTVTVAALLIGSLYGYANYPGFVRGAMTLAMVWWLAAFVWICLAPTRVTPRAAAVAGVLALVPCWLALVYITFTTNSTYWVLFTLALVWAADTGAYFAGRFFGKVPLAPRVSPKKTWEGVIGGLAVSGAVAAVGGAWLGVGGVPFIMLCVVVAAISVVGDLTESMLKRAAGLKDSGSLFPGHGGALDRIDSVTAAAPTLVFGLFGLGILP